MSRWVSVVIYASLCGVTPYVIAQPQAHERLMTTRCAELLPLPMKPNIIARMPYYQAHIEPLCSTFESAMMELEIEQAPERMQVKKWRRQRYKREVQALESELKKLNDDRAARLSHRRRALQDFERVKSLAERSPKQGERALRLFTQEYQQHPLGNPLTTEALDLSEELKLRQIEERKARLSAPHLKMVLESWWEVRRLVNKGTEESEEALQSFLDRYAEHPLGNPLEAEAKELFTKAQRRYQARVKRAHIKRVKRAWRNVKKQMKRGRSYGEEALIDFLDTYESHELGNPYESKAKGTLQYLETLKSPQAPKAPHEITWVRVPQGVLQFGRGAPAPHRPTRVRITQPFLMSKTEVTVAQYRGCVEETACPTPSVYSVHCNWGQPGREDHPMNCVSWDEARTFAQWLGSSVELPTEAEWEYAARGGQDFEYAGSSDADEVGWYASNATGLGTRPVGAKMMNGYGLYDMSGNVAEWVLDRYVETSAKAKEEPQQEGALSASQNKSEPVAVQRVLRGGSWSHHAKDARVFARQHELSSYHLRFVGFRVKTQDMSYERALHTIDISDLPKDQYYAFTDDSFDLESLTNRTRDSFKNKVLLLSESSTKGIVPYYNFKFMESVKCFYRSDLNEVDLTVPIESFSAKVWTIKWVSFKHYICPYSNQNNFEYTNIFVHIFHDHTDMSKSLINYKVNIFSMIDAPYEFKDIINKTTPRIMVTLEAYKLSKYLHLKSVPDFHK